MRTNIISIDCSVPDACFPYLAHGWAATERGGGTWTDGTVAEILMMITPPPADDVILRSHMTPYVNAGHPELKVSVEAGGVEVGIWRFEADHLGEASRRDETVVIPAVLIPDGELVLTFRIDSPVSPFEQGLSDDERDLGLWVHGFALDLSQAVPGSLEAGYTVAAYGSPEDQKPDAGWAGSPVSRPVRAARLDGPAGQFLDYYGADHSSSIVEIGGERFYVKYFESRFQQQTSLLAQALAADSLNIPLHIAPDASLKSAVEDHLRAEGVEVGQRFETDAPVSDHMLLVRLCQDYSPAELPMRDMTQAIAAELVFSIWIGRDDPHNSNRSFRDGLPVFFDFGRRVLNRQMRKVYFRPGQVSAWRLLPTPAGLAVDTAALRAVERDRPLTLHPVTDAASFWTHWEEQARRIAGLSPDFLAGAVSETIGMPHTRELALNYLLEQQLALPDTLARAAALLSQPIVEEDHAALEAAGLIAR